MSDLDAFAADWGRQMLDEAADASDELPHLHIAGDLIPADDVPGADEW